MPARTGIKIVDKSSSELQNKVRCGRVTDVTLIHRAYEERMRELELPAADLSTYIKVTNLISPFGVNHHGGNL
jgi:hypothetical protein